MALLTFLARTGQMDTHRIQDMHLLLSVDLGVFAEMAAITWNPAFVGYKRMYFTLIFQMYCWI